MDGPTEEQARAHLWTVLLSLVGVILLQALTDPTLQRTYAALRSLVW